MCDENQGPDVDCLPLATSFYFSLILLRKSIFQFFFYLIMKLNLYDLYLLYFTLYTKDCHRENATWNSKIATTITILNNVDNDRNKLIKSLLNEKPCIRDLPHDLSSPSIHYKSNIKPGYKHCFIQFSVAIAA